MHQLWGVELVFCQIGGDVLFGLLSDPLAFSGRYLCCDTQQEQREWFATFLSVQHGANNLWPSDTRKVRASRVQQDSRLGNISLIPLRGNENEMRNSVAAFTTDPLTLLRDL
ncbi:arf-GAP with Rho-GAP domain, ANK repeat and PH domain-containing protein 1 [Sphaerodactylus townsendi]|uniref:Arf-GAP with Rho-GAP domain, ANK repeat and PH domain-containing protein 1 n=1 Tax=Sphaerodactylus townsendi TaxID=933632 RepID=A0ACB8FFI7_9SAUR|nr:arf-GAP with Rho-GAP domain, ANK repeat and PH domain-containing protein 1 [Sphaerodactylus townsendi]